MAGHDAPPLAKKLAMVSWAEDLSRPEQSSQLRIRNSEEINKPGANVPGKAATAMAPNLWAGRADAGHSVSPWQYGQNSQIPWHKQTG